MRKWLRISTGPTVWITAVHAAWTITLVLWILYFVERRSRLPHEGWGVLVAGILLLVLMLAGVTIIVIHFARQVVHTRAVKDFISRVSHDLRSPLAIVRLHLQTMQLRDLTETQRRQCLETALLELGRLESGIEDILTASRVERQGLRLDTEPIELGAFVSAYAEQKSAEAQVLGAQLEWLKASSASLVVWADPTLLRQMLDNLIDNAIVHCPRGVRIQIDLSEHGGCAVLGVRDDGPGLARREWKRVFRMFYRASGATAHRRGTGLGLFIVSGIARAHGGRAWVDSAGPGRGCHFRVAIPLMRSGARAA